MNSESLMESRALRFALVHEDIGDLATLRKKIQIAIELEFSTIPLYLTSLYSFRDRSSSAYQLVRSVVVEEMFHVNAVCNLLVAVNGKPVLTGNAAPTYPSYLPSADTDPYDPDPTPYVVLARATPSQFKNIFMRIEKPAPYRAPAQDERYQTIGQFYKAIEKGLESCVDKYGEGTVFPAETEGEQRTDIYIGKFGGKTPKITDLTSAKFVIGQIVEQGEGAVMPGKPLVPVQPYGAYNNYGKRIDGTYGPIMGTPYELSHYFKFKEIVDDATNFPSVYPIIAPSLIDSYDDNKAAQDLAVVFDQLYSVMLNALQKAFEKGTNGRDVFYKLALPIMHKTLVATSAQLMTTPIYGKGDASVGPNAAPLWRYQPTATLREASQHLEAVDANLPIATPPLQDAGIPADRLSLLVSELARRSAVMGSDL